MRRLFENEIENMRDIGGYKAGDNKRVKYNCFIRSNLPMSLSGESIKSLMEEKIITVIDLRSDAELERKKGVFYDNSFFDYYHVVVKGDGIIPEKPEDIYDSYLEMLDGKEAICQIFKIILESSGGILYYCNAGKDRTGIITALILKLLGVSDEDIVEDYFLSAIYLKQMMEKYAKNSGKENMLDIITPKKENMVKILDYLQKEYNGVEMYLNECGITSNEIELLKIKYLFLDN